MTPLAPLVLVALPLATGVLAARIAAVRPGTATRISVGAAIGIVVLATLAPVDTALTLPSGRLLVLSPIAQFAVQLLGLALLGLTVALIHEPAAGLDSWLPVSWISVGGLSAALLIGNPDGSPALPLAFLTFMGAILIWVFGLPPEERPTAGGPVLRFAALVGLALPLLLGAARLAEDRLTSAAGRVAIERTVLALALPGFGLVLGLVPLHAWTLTLAAGAPRPMLYGMLALGQTAGYALLLRTLSAHGWLLRGTPGELVVAAGALTAVVAGWLALSADPDDPDDWMAYAVVANMGFLVAALGTGSRTAGLGAALFLIARVLALVLLALRSGASDRAQRLAEGAATMTLAGTPGMAGFPGLWLILIGTRLVSGPATAALALGSLMLFATALRRTLFRRPSRGAPTWWRARGPDRAVVVLAAVLVLLGLVPALFAGAIADPLREVYFPFAGP